MHSYYPNCCTMKFTLSSNCRPLIVWSHTQFICIYWILFIFFNTFVFCALREALPLNALWEWEAVPECILRLHPFFHNPICFNGITVNWPYLGGWGKHKPQNFWINQNNPCWTDVMPPSLVPPYLQFIEHHWHWKSIQLGEGRLFSSLNILSIHLLNMIHQYCDGTANNWTHCIPLELQNSIKIIQALKSPWSVELMYSGLNLYTAGNPQPANAILQIYMSLFWIFLSLHKELSSVFQGTWYYIFQ